MNEPQLTISIVNWNGIAFLPDCLRSIVENPPLFSFEVIVVDNDSTDGSPDWLRSEDCKQLMQNVPLHVIEPRENLGFGPGHNLAINASNAPNVFILNPDTLVTSGALDKLVETLQSAPEIGMVGPKVLYEDGSLQHSVVRHPETPASIISDAFEAHKLLPNALVSRWLLGPHWSHDQRRSVPVIGGAAMMCKREMINATGGFDPSIHMYAEEYEWCIRARREKWNIVFEPEASIVHLRGKSTVQRWSDDERIVVQEKALIYYENKSFSKLLNLSNCITKVSILSGHILRWKWQGREASSLRQLRRLRLENCKQIIFGPRKDINTGKVN
jgi:GT2 family glycosyltransferase